MRYIGPRRALLSGGTPPSLDLRFTAGGGLDPRITFTRASAASYFDATGTLQSATTNVPRFDFDSVMHQPLGLLIEEARTNLLFPSALTVSNWVAIGPSTLTNNALAALDGTVSAASLFASDTTSATRQASHVAIAATGSTAYTVSAYLKSNVTNAAHIQINSGSAAAAAYFDLVNGVAVVGADLIAGITGKSVSITPMGGGWYRCTFICMTPSGATTIQPYFGPSTVVSTSGDNRAYTGVVGQGVWLWGAQVEAGAFATSYIPTTTATVTRAADVATMTVGAWFTAAARTVQAEVLPATLAPSVFARVLQIDDGTNTNAIAFLTTPTSNPPVGFYGVAGSSGTVDPVPDIYNLTVRKMAIAVTPTTTAMAHNGTAAKGLAPGTQAVYTTLHFSDAGGGGQINGWLRRVRYWPRAMGVPELQAATR